MFYKMVLPITSAILHATSSQVSSELIIFFNPVVTMVGYCEMISSKTMFAPINQCMYVWSFNHD